MTKAREELERKVDLASENIRLKRRIKIFKCGLVGLGLVACFGIGLGYLLNSSKVEESSYQESVETSTLVSSDRSNIIDVREEKIVNTTNERINQIVTEYNKFIESI